MRRFLFRCRTNGFFVIAFLASPMLVSAQQAVLRTRTNLVLVPTLVEDQAGQPIFNLTSKDFRVTDNGVEQKIRLDTETDSSAMSIVVLVQSGRSAVREFHKLRGLPTMVGALAGNTRHRIAVVEFDSRPHMVQDFTGDPDSVERALHSVEPGDGGAAILDSVWYAVDMLADEPSQNQRVVLLISESRDHGSVTPIQDAIRKIGRTDVIVNSLTFSPARSDLMDFSNPGSGIDLLPLLRLTVAALKKNTAAAIPEMTGGKYLPFRSGKQLDREMSILANQVHNRYILSFQPSNPTPGLHLLKVDLRQSLPAHVLARRSYWAAGQAGISAAEPGQLRLAPIVPKTHGLPQN